jgi:hypothetical protein
MTIGLLAFFRFPIYHWGIMLKQDIGVFFIIVGCFFLVIEIKRAIRKKLKKTPVSKKPYKEKV